MAVISKLDYKGQNITKYNNSIISNISLPILPNEYQEVEYIESNENQYIDTNIKMGINISLEAGVEIPYSESTLYRGRSGAVLAGNQGWFAFGDYGLGELSVYFCKTTREGVSIPFDNNYHTYYVSNGLQKIDGVETNITISSDFARAINLWLLGYNINYTNEPRQFGQRMYYAKIWDNGVLVRDFVPCYRKSDNVAGLYDLVEKKFYTNSGTGEFIVGNNNVKGIDYHFAKNTESTGTCDNAVEEPIIDLKISGNSVQESENLFNPQKTLTYGVYLTNDGTEIASGIWRITDYIEVNGYEFTLTNVGGTAPSICAYDENKNFITGVAYGTEKAEIKTNVTISSTTLIKYIRFSIFHSWVSDGSINDISLTYKLTPKTPIEIKSVGQRTLNLCQNFSSKYPVDAEMEANKFPVKANTLYSINFNSNKEAYKTIWLYDNNGTLTKRLTYAYAPQLYDKMVVLAEQDGYMSVGIVDVDAKVIVAEGQYFTLNTTQQNNLNNNKITTTVTSGELEYEPYGYKIPVKVNNTTTNIYLNEPLRKVGDYADYIDYKNKKVVRYIKSRKILSEYSWQSSVNNANGYPCYWVTFQEDSLRSYGHSICSHFKFRGTAWAYGVYGEYSDHPSTNRYYFITDKSTLEEWKEWLNNNDVSVDFILLTPTEETIDIPEISTSKGTNKFVVETTIKPSELKINYWKQIGAVEAEEEIIQNGSDILIIKTGADITQSGSNLLIGE